MKYLLLILFSMMIQFGFGQRPGNQYYRLLAQAQSFYQDKDYLKSAKIYTEIFNNCKLNMQTNDYYDAACSYALSNLPDSGMRYLSYAVNEKKFSDFDHLQSDSDLITLHDVTGWVNIIENAKYNQQQKEKGYNRPVVSLLDCIFNLDQGGRTTADSIEKKNGYQSVEMKKYLRELNLQDSLNLIKVTSVIDKYGWLGPDKVGDKGSTTLFLVIQHADKKVHEKYLPIMRKAVLNGNAKGSYLALLEDRTALEEGKMQIYGSQVIRDKKTGKPAFAPIEDEKSVDSRRESVGLGPLEEYAKLFHINYYNSGSDPAVEKPQP